MSLRILLFTSAVATIALSFNSVHLDKKVITSQFGVVPFKYGCKYRVSSVWNDIFFLVDRSGSYGDFAQLFFTMNKIISAFQLTKIGSTKEYSVRAGVAFFSNKTTIVGQFGQIITSDITSINTLNYYDENENMADIDLALKTAETQLAKSDRPLSKKVIVLMTTQVGYQTSSSSYNTTFAEQLKSKGYILNVYNLQNPAAPSDLSQIQQLASSGYATDSIKNTVEDLQRIQATANCFCDTQLYSFTDDNKTGVPTGGCYGIPLNPQLSYNSAKSFCSNNFRGGIITMDETQEKADFLNKLNNNTEPFFIGLKWTDEFTQPLWLWEDGTTLDDEDFNLFSSGSIPAGSNSLDCVVQFPGENHWQTTNCKSLQRYVCETAPCDSTNYYCTPSY